MCIDSGYAAQRHDGTGISAFQLRIENLIDKSGLGQ